MNAVEMAANPALSEHVARDLTLSPQLPHESGAFDAVLCTASVEYLV